MKIADRNAETLDEPRSNLERCCHRKLPLGDCDSGHFE